MVSALLPSATISSSSPISSRRKAGGGVLRHRRREQQRELIPAPARQKHPAADALMQVFGNRHQHAVADQMAERVVDVLEPVEVDQRHHHRIAPGMLHGGGELAVEGGAVEQPGQPVVLGGALQGGIAQVFLGAVVNDPGDAVGPTVDVEPLAHHPDAALLAVAAADAGFEGKGLAPRDGRFDRGADHRSILAVVQRHDVLDVDRSSRLQPGDGIDLIRPVELPRGEIDPPRSDIGGAFGLTENLRGLLERGIGQAQLAGAGTQCDALFGQFGEHCERGDLIAGKGMRLGRDRAQGPEQRAALRTDRHAEIGADEGGACDQRIVAKARIGAGIADQQRRLVGDAHRAERYIARGLAVIETGAAEEPLPVFLDDRKQRGGATQHGAGQQRYAREQRPVGARLKVETADGFKASGFLHFAGMVLSRLRISHAGDRYACAPRWAQDSRLRARIPASGPRGAKSRFQGRIWCGREDSNFHGLSPTTTSTLRVYQFRHDRTRVFRGSQMLAPR